MNAEQLRYKMKNLDALLPDRSVTNDEQFHELYSKLRDLIEDTNYRGCQAVFQHCLDP